MASEVGVQIYSLDQVEDIGAAFGPPQYRAPASSDIITINYTSGTTGAPKGVTLLHSNAVAGASCAHAMIEHHPGRSLLSYLPLAHIYERLMQHGLLWCGGSIGFFHGDILALVDDLKMLKPNAFISVPRLYNRFGGAIRAATTQQQGLKGTFSRHVLDTKIANMTPADAPTATNKHALYDWISGRKLTADLGIHNATKMISGSAPLDPSLHQFFRAVTGNNFVQGYGLTETYALGTCQLPGDMSVGNCGAVSPSMELCLMDVPDMDYYASDKPQPRGEILIRGTTVFAGYYINLEDTEKA